MEICLKSLVSASIDGQWICMWLHVHVYALRLYLTQLCVPHWFGFVVLFDEVSQNFMEANFLETEVSVTHADSKDGTF